MERKTVVPKIGVQADLRNSRPGGHIGRCTLFVIITNMSMHATGDRGDGPSGRADEAAGERRGRRQGAARALHSPVRAGAAVGAEGRGAPGRGRGDARGLRTPRLDGAPRRSIAAAGSLQSSGSCAPAGGAGAPADLAP